MASNDGHRGERRRCAEPQTMMKYLFIYLRIETAIVCVGENGVQARLTANNTKSLLRLWRHKQCFDCAEENQKDRAPEGAMHL
jgi:hypothetical protein